MLVSHTKRFIFLKTAKTAGTSVESYFEQNCMPAGQWQQSHSREQYISDTGIIGCRGPKKDGQTYFNHIGAKALKALLPNDIWHNYYKFTVVRNPFDKQISAFYFFNTNNQVLTVEEPRDIVKKFRQWLKSTKGIYDGDKYLIDGEFVLDDVIKYENLTDDIKRVCHLLDITYSPELLPNFKAGFRPKNGIPIADYFDQECIDIVATRYRFELSFFGYNSPAVGA